MKSSKESGERAYVRADECGSILRDLGGIISIKYQALCIHYDDAFMYASVCSDWSLPFLRIPSSGPSNYWQFYEIPQADLSIQPFCLPIVSSKAPILSFQPTNIIWSILLISLIRSNSTLLISIHCSRWSWTPREYISSARTIECFPAIFCWLSCYLVSSISGLDFSLEAVPHFSWTDWCTPHISYEALPFMTQIAWRGYRVSCLGTEKLHLSCWGNLRVRLRCLVGTKSRRIKGLLASKRDTFDIFGRIDPFMLR